MLLRPQVDLLDRCCRPNKALGMRRPLIERMKRSLLCLVVSLVAFHVSVYFLFNTSEGALYFAVVFPVFFSHCVDESHQNAKTASHDNASNRRAHRISLGGLRLHLLLVQVCLGLLAVRQLLRLQFLFVLALLLVGRQLLRLPQRLPLVLRCLFVFCRSCYAFV